MKRGNWVPISRGFTASLPKDRPYTELEAAYSVSCDIAAGKKVSVAGYAKLWKWNRKKVSRWMRDTGWMIRAERKRKPNPVSVIRGAIGQALIHDPNWIDEGSTEGTTEGQLRVQLRDNSKNGKSRSNKTKGTTEGQLRDNCGTTEGSLLTINQINPIKKGRKEVPVEGDDPEENPFM